MQVIADPHGRLIWLSPALPTATHDLTAALTAAAVATLADRAYCGAGGAIGVPHYGRDLPARMRACNTSHNQIRGIGECANATLKTWLLLRRLRCCPQRVTALTAAVLVVLQQIEGQHG